MNEVVKITLKAVAGLFALGMGAKLSKDAVQQSKEFKKNKK
tara:strand:+ start:227 stop:349 length:123 start_codon:yes stop_codon:yes gene_type:complete